MNFRLLFILLPFSCFCQNQFRFETFSIKDGLSQNTVNCILKDSEGIYWFGTQDGLNKFDGNTVKIYRHDKDDSTTISDNFILNIIEDGNKNLWIGTRNGFNFFNRKNGKFSKIVISERERTDFHNSIFFSFKDEKENIYFVNYYNQFAEISSANGLKPPFTPLVLKENVKLLQISRNSYCVLDYLKQKITSFSSNNNMLWEYHNSHINDLTLMLETTGGEIIAVISDNVALLDRKNEMKIFSVILTGKKINCLFEDSKGNIWIGGKEGIYLFKNGDLNSPPVLLFHNSEDIHSLSSNSVQAIYEDYNGLIWIGTSEGGVNIYDPEESRFNFFNHYSDIPLSANSVWGIYQDKNELWVGTDNGLNHLTFLNNNITKVYSQKNKIISSEVFKFNGSYPNSICSNFITCITKDKSGNIWFGSNSNGISVYNPSLKKWTQFNTKNSPLKTDVIFHLFSASDGKIWISTMFGFYCYDPVSGKFKSFQADPGVNKDFSSGYIISIFEDMKKCVWVASTHGIYYIDNKGDMTFYKNETNNSRSLSYNIVTSFFQDSKKRLWVATLGGGINIFDPETQTFRSLTTKDGLINDITYKIIEDKNSNLWISTNSGLSCYNPEKNSFTDFTVKDGLVANEFIQNSGFINDNGELLFGTPEGLVVFNPEEIKDNNYEIPLILSSLKVNYIEQNYTSGNSVSLYNNDKTITFQFASPDFRNKERIHYSYKLDGFDDEWHEISASDRIASYTNLPFGSYVFRVRIRNGNSVWQKKELSVDLNVIPPFWLKTWFIILEIISFIIVVIIIVRYYSQRKLKQRLNKIEIQQKIYHERERISRDLHDNVGSHLTYIITTLDNISYKMEKGEKDISQDKISSLSDFSRSTMQELRESIWALNKESILLSELKDKICEYSSRMASSGNMDFDIEFLSENNCILKPSQAINLYRIIQEAVNNSVKHSNANSLNITICEQNNNNVSVEIKDNGKGINNDDATNGYGLKNIQDRVKDINGLISIDSGDKGTKICISVPV